MRPFKRPRLRKGRIGKIPRKVGKITKTNQESPKKANRDGQVPTGKPPRLKPPRLAALKTLVNVREVLANMALWVHRSSPNFDRLRQSSHQGARMVLVSPGTCLTLNSESLKKVENGVEKDSNKFVGVSRGNTIMGQQD